MSLEYLDRFQPSHVFVCDIRKIQRNEQRMQQREKVIIILENVSRHT